MCGLGKREGLVRGMERKAVRGRAHDTQTLTAFKYAHAHGACVSELISEIACPNKIDSWSSRQRHFDRKAFLHTKGFKVAERRFLP